MTPATGELISYFDLHSTQAHMYMYKNYIQTKRNIQFVKVPHFRVICPVFLYMGIITCKDIVMALIENAHPPNTRVEG